MILVNKQKNIFKVKLNIQIIFLLLEKMQEINC